MRHCWEVQEETQEWTMGCASDGEKKTGLSEREEGARRDRGH